MMIARVRTRESGGEPRKVEELLFSGRMPTTVSGRQGDHTVAEGLLRRVVHQVVGKTRQEALGLVLGLVDHSSLPKEKVEAIFAECQDDHASLSTKDGEDQNRILENAIQDYVRAANKRAYTAFSRKDKKTEGGGGERAALAALDKLAEKYYTQYQDSIPDPDAIDRSDRETFVDNLCVLVDYAGKEEKVPEEAANVVERAMATALDRVPFYAIWEMLLDQVVDGLFEGKEFQSKSIGQSEGQIQKLLYRRISGSVGAGSG